MKQIAKLHDVLKSLLSNEQLRVCKTVPCNLSVQCAATSDAVLCLPESVSRCAESVSHYIEAKACEAWCCA